MRCLIWYSITNMPAFTKEERHCNIFDNCSAKGEQLNCH